MSEGKAEMSPLKLGMMLFALSLIWILCYNGEKQIPGRQLLDTYDRMQDRNISKQKIQKAQQKVAKYEEGSEDLSSDESPSHELQKQLCIIVSSSSDMKVNGKDAWQLFLNSLLEQSYENYKIYYFDDKNKGSEIVSLRSKFNIPQQRFKYIPLDKPTSKLQNFFTGGQAYCKEGSIIIPLVQNSLLLGKDVFKKVNTAMQQKEVLWSGYLDANKQLGRSSAYPDQTIYILEFYNYPFVAMGLQAFSFNNFKQISESSVKSKNNEYFEHATKMAYGLPALMEAKDKIHYLNEILLLDRESEVYVTLDQKMKAQIYQITEKVREKVKN